jgi:aryl-alcohol dehydrogenase-like predicted oxidoreductase
MDYRTLGRTGLRVSALGFGCGNVGGLMVRGQPAERERAVARAMELGINYFDTAPSYGDGLSERHLGPVPVAEIPAAITRSLDESLRRLDRERVDLLQLHDPIGVPRRGTSLSGKDVLDVVVPALARLAAQGKTRFYGITALGDATALGEVIGAGAIHTAQVCYNLLNPTAGHAVPAGFPAQDFGRFLPRARERGTGVIVIRVLAAGALSGIEARHPIAVPSVEPIASGPDYATDVHRTRALAALVDEGHVESLVEASLRFALASDAVSTVLLGYSSQEHLEYAAASINKGPLPPAVLARLPALWERLAHA